MTDSLEGTTGDHPTFTASGDPTVRPPQSGPEAFWIPDQAHILSVEPRKEGGPGRWRPVLGIAIGVLVLGGLVVAAVFVARAISSDDEKARDDSGWSRQSPVKGSFHVDMPKTVRDERTAVTRFGSVTSSMLISDRGRWDLIVAESRFPDGADFDLRSAAGAALDLVDGDLTTFRGDDSGLLEAADVEGTARRDGADAAVVGRLQRLPHGAAVYLVVGPSGHESGMRADLDRVLDSSSVNG